MSRLVAHFFSTGVIFSLCLGLTACPSSKGKGDGEGGSISDQDLALEQSRYGEGNIPEARSGGIFDDVYFDYDSSAVKQNFYDAIKKNASVVAADKTLHLEVEGHCDKRGTNEYNLALGEERAKAVAALLVNYGISPSQVSTISYGEEIPVDPTDSEDAFAKNRRAHFALYRNKSDGAGSPGGRGPAGGQRSGETGVGGGGSARGATTNNTY